MGKGSTSARVRVTEYFMSILYGICHGPVDSLNRIRVNEKVVWFGEVTRPTAFNSDKRGAFGGSKKEGGVAGAVVFQPGTMYQYSSDAFARKVGRTKENCPAFRGIANVFFTGPPSLDPVLEEAEPEEPLDAAEPPQFEDPNVTRVVAALIKGIESSGGSEIGSRDGFYWSSNQPFIWPSAFHVTRIPGGWQPELARVEESVETSRAVLFNLDNSAAMTPARRTVMVDAVLAALDQFRAQIFDVGLDLTLGVNIWGSTGTLRTWAGTTQAGIDEAKDLVVASINGTGGTANLKKAADGISTFFNSTLVRDYSRRMSFTISAGTILSGSDEEAKDSIEDILDRSSATFNIPNGTAVDSYAISLETTNVSRIEKIDNTSGFDKSVSTNGTVPVIPAGDTTALLEVIREGVRGSNFPDANPAHIVREVITDPLYGAGAAAASLEDPSFVYAAQVLYDEGFGLSMMWTQQQEADAFVQEVLDHIDATLFLNPYSGKFELRLLRDDYVLEETPIFDESNCTVRSFSRRAPSEAVNEINVSWTNPESEEEEVITGQDLGNIVANAGEIKSDNRNYYGIRRRSLANQVLARDLASATAPLATVEIEVDRRAAKVLPGDVFRLSSEEHNADTIAMRVAKVNYGRPGDSKILISATEDIFAFTKPRARDLEDDADDAPGPRYPTPFEYVQFMTLNYFLTGTLVDAYASGSAEYPDTFVGVFASTENVDARELDLVAEATDPAGNVSFQPAGTKNLIALGHLQEDWAEEATTTTLGFGDLTSGNLPREGGFLIIGGLDLPEEEKELAIIKTLSEGEFTIWRGVLDTVPAQWPMGTPVQFFSTSMSVAENASTPALAEAKYKTLMHTSLGVYDMGFAPERTFTPNERPYLPTRPANVLVGGYASGEVDNAALTFPLAVSWATRNRLTEDSQVVGWEEGSVTPEVGQTTSILLIDPGTGTVFSRYDGLEGDSAELPLSAFAGYSQVDVKVVSVRDGFESLTGQSVRVSFTSGYGYNYGFDYGGSNG